MGAEVETLVAVSWKISVDAIPKQGGKKGIEKERERERERERGGGVGGTDGWRVKDVEVGVKARNMRYHLTN